MRLLSGGVVPDGALKLFPRGVFPGGVFPGGVLRLFPSGVFPGGPFGVFPI